MEGVPGAFLGFPGRARFTIGVVGVEAALDRSRRSSVVSRRSSARAEKSSANRLTERARPSVLVCDGIPTALASGPYATTQLE